MHKEEDSYDPEEGARPPSLIAVHKLATPDPIYDLQLMRDLEIINARTRADLGPLPPGGVPARSDRRPEVRPFTTTEQSQEDETMKLQDVVMAAALSVVTGGPAVASGSLVEVSNVAQERALESVTNAEAKAGTARHMAVKKPRLNPKYAKLGSFSEFRRKVIKDGWMPVTNPDCHDTVMGGYYDEYCSEEPDALSCRLCTMVPELFRHTSDGYNLMRYTKGGVLVGVTVFGDMQDLEAPEKFGLLIVGWDYSESLNVILIDD